MTAEDKALIDSLERRASDAIFTGCMMALAAWRSTEEGMRREAGSWSIRVRADQMLHLIELARKT